MKQLLTYLSVLLLGLCSAARAAELTTILNSINLSPQGTWDFTGGTILVSEGDLPDALTRDSEVSTWFDAPSSNPSFDPESWRADLDLDSLSNAETRWGVNILTPGESLAWADVTGRPTTLSGYGITDAASAAQGALASTALQPSTVSPAFFQVNGFDLGLYQLLAMGEPRVDWGAGTLYGPTGLVDERLDWEGRILSGAWTVDALSATTLTVTDAINFPDQSVSRGAIEDAAVGPQQLDELGAYTVSSLSLTDVLSLTDIDTDPPNPPTGGAVIWLSSGAGSGDPGDLMVKINSGGTTVIFTLIDYAP